VLRERADEAVAECGTLCDCEVLDIVDEDGTGLLALCLYEIW